MKMHQSHNDEIELEQRLRDTFDAQALALPPLRLSADHILDQAAAGPAPLVTADDGIAVLDDRRRTAPKRQRTVLVGVAAALLVAMVGAVTLMRAPDRTATTDPAADPDPGVVLDETAASGGIDPRTLTHQWKTTTVQAAAEGVTVETAGLTFTPPLELGDPYTEPNRIRVDGDPGTDEYQTLELTWFEHDREMRINLYFAADDTDWWVREIRVYNGEVQSDWLGSWTGEYFRTPLGEAYVGVVDLDGVLRIDTLVLTAFTPPAACSNPDAGALELVPSYDSIDMRGADGFGLTATLIDTGDCGGVDLADYTVEAVVLDETVATVRLDNIAGITPADTSRWSVTDVGEGETTLELTVRDSAGAVIASASIPVRGDGSPVVNTTQMEPQPSSLDTSQSEGEPSSTTEMHNP